MRGIDIHNYEAFLLDYLEGNLDENAVAELKLFALAHPELEISLEETELPAIQPEEPKADFKEELFRFSTLAEAELLAYIENTMSAAERAELENRINTDPALARELAIFRKTLLSPDLSIHTDKTTLYKNEEDLAVNYEVLNYTEGLLNSSGRKAFELRLLVDPELRREVELYQNLKLQPDTSVVYPFRHKLKKQARIISLSSARKQKYAAAAAVLLFASLAVVISYLNPAGTKQSVAGIHPAIKNKQVPAGNFVSSITPEKDTPTEPGSVSQPVKNLGKNSPAIKGAMHTMREQNEIQVAAKDQEKETGNSSLPVLVPEFTPPVILPANEKPVPDSHLAVQTMTVPAADLAHVEYTSVGSDFYDFEEETPVRASFWHRITRLAAEANKLGVKAVEGEMRAGNGYRFSFRSFSVEKK